MMPDMVDAAYCGNSEVILHVPHSSLEIPPQVRRNIHLSDADLASELTRMTDWYTDELFSLEDVQIPRIVFPYSRLVCDVERFTDETTEPMSVWGMGAIYEHTSNGKTLRDQITGEERVAYLNTFYHPHHRRLQDITDKILSLQQRVLIIDCHSFPTIPLPCDLSQVLDRPDICIGTDKFHTPLELVREIELLCAKLGLSIAIDQPFAGTMVPQKHFRRDERVKSVMIEIRRGLYVDENSGEKLATFDAVRSKIQSILSELQRHTLSGKMSIFN